METAAAPVNTALPSISGTAASGQTLTCSPGTFTENPTLAFAWLSDGAVVGSGCDVRRRCGTARHGDPVPGDGDEPQGLDGGDVSSSRAAQAAGRDAAGRAGKHSASQLRRNPADRSEADLRAGDLLEMPVRPQRRGCATAPGSPAALTYTLVAADAKKAIQCQVTATGAGGSVVAESAPRVSAKACIVPALKGKTLAAAKRALKKANCATGKTKTRTSSKKAGTVIASSPAKGNNLAAGTKVALTVAKQ